jgi:tRNA U34 5-carboxymethylaminomethyl modifying GTPase MnmE/TrmE
MFIRGAKIVLICFERPDVKLVQKHIEEVERIDPSVRIILVITKIDRIKFRDIEKMEEYASSVKLTIFSTSALTGQGIQSLFEEVARHFLSIDTDRKSSDEILDTVELRTDTPNPGAFTQCCIML